MFRRCSRLLSTATQQGPFNPYKILGVTEGASKDDIKRAYHRLALKYHPDSGREGSTERFQAVQEAYEAVKEGKWQGSGAQDGNARQAQQAGAYGWDAKRRTYTYEEPGSTTENYVSGRVQTLLRLCVAWCMAFVVIRMLLLFVFSTKYSGPLIPDATPTLADFGGKDSSSISASSVNGVPSPSSVHNDDDFDVYMRASNDRTVDPLSRR